MTNETQKPARPPRWADNLLEWFCAFHLLEDVQGDLHEVYHKRVRQVGQAQARREFAAAVFFYINPFFRNHKPPVRSGTAYRFDPYSSPSILTPSMLRNYIKIALRTLTHNKAYSVINVVGLSIGLAAAMLIMLYTKDEVSYDRFHANNPNIYRITSQELSPAGKLEHVQSNTGHFQGPKFSAGIPEIQSFVRYQGDRHDMKRGNEVISQEAFAADSSFFSVFSFPLLSGNPKTALKEPHSVVISEEMAQKQFGTTDALGKTISLRSSYGDNADFEPYRVTGVAQKCPQNSSIKFDVLLPLIVSSEEMENPENWFNVFQNTFVVLSPSATPTPTRIKAVEAKMNQIYLADAKEAIKQQAEKFGVKTRVSYTLQPFTDMHLSTDLPAQNGLVDNSNPDFSYILSGIALFILLIACINFVNLTIARSLKRAKEIGVRKVVGSGRMQLTIQFLGESYLLCLGAFILAIGLVELVLPTFNQLANKSLALSYLFDIQLVLGYIGLFIATGFLAGFYPALVFVELQPRSNLV